MALGGNFKKKYYDPLNIHFFNVPEFYPKEGARHMDCTRVLTDPDNGQNLYFCVPVIL